MSGRIEAATVLLLFSFHFVLMTDRDGSEISLVAYKYGILG